MPITEPSVIIHSPRIFPLSPKSLHWVLTSLLGFLPDPSQYIQSGIHHFCPKLAPCLVLCFSPCHSVRLLLKLETICVFSFRFPPMSNHCSQCFLNFFCNQSKLLLCTPNCVHILSLISKCLEKMKHGRWQWFLSVGVFLVSVMELLLIATETQTLSFFLTEFGFVQIFTSSPASEGNSK